MEIKYIYAAAEIIGAFLCLMAAGYLTMIRSIIKEQNRALAATELVVGVMLLCDGLAWYYRGVPGNVAFLTLYIVNYITIACNSILPVFLCVYVIRSMEKEGRSIGVLNTIGASAVFLELFLFMSHTTHFIYFINSETNLYQRGRGFVIWSAMNVIPILILIAYSISRREYFSRGRLSAILLFAILPLLTIFIQSFIYGLSLSNFSVLLCALGMFAQAIQENVHMMVEQRDQIARQEIELVEMRNRIALSQIKPHFLYNTLNSIYVLCDLDKEQAKTAVNNLSNYLRGNLGSIESRAPIPFEKELEHTKVYIELEKLRFQDRFDVIYNINATDFTIPALTVQPLAENAIKHGLCKKKRGEKGILRISTFDNGDSYSIIIEDNGVGFDMEEYNNQQVIPGQHIGLRNVRERIKILENADFSVSSEKGAGTKIEITIPKT